MKDNSYPTTMELKGNELGWIIKLAEDHYLSEGFRKGMDKNNLRGLYAKLGTILGRFRWIPLSSQQTWIISIKES